MTYLHGFFFVFLRYAEYTLDILNNKALNKFFQVSQNTSEKTTEFKTTLGDGQEFLLDFEKFVSEQDVSFFSQQMDTSTHAYILI